MMSFSLISADGFPEGRVKKLLGNILGGLNQFQSDTEGSSGKQVL